MEKGSIVRGKLSKYGKIHYLEVTSTMPRGFLEVKKLGSKNKMRYIVNKYNILERVKKSAFRINYKIYDSNAKILYLPLETREKTPLQRALISICADGTEIIHATKWRFGEKAVGKYIVLERPAMKVLRLVPVSEKNPHLVKKPFVKIVVKEYIQ